MINAFIFGRFAVTSEHFETVEPDGSHEYGARVQLRHVRSDVVDAERHAIARDGLHTTVGDPIWRADLFGVVGGAPGNTDHAHFHPTFAEMQPCERQFVAEIVADPIGWTRAELGDVGTLMTVAATRDLVDPPDQAELDEAWPAIEASIRANLPGPRLPPDDVAQASFTH